MFLQITWWPAFVVTLWATEWFLVCVGSFMSLQVICKSKNFVTFRADKSVLLTGSFDRALFWGDLLAIHFTAVLGYQYWQSEILLFKNWPLEKSYRSSASCFWTRYLEQQLLTTININKFIFLSWSREAALSWDLLFFVSSMSQTGLTLYLRQQIEFLPRVPHSSVMATQPI